MAFTLMSKAATNVYARYLSFEFFMLLIALKLTDYMHSRAATIEDFIQRRTKGK